MAAPAKDTRLSTPSTPLARSAAAAAERARSRYSGSDRCAGFARPEGSRAGRNSRSWSSRIERAAETAARSAARWSRAPLVAALPSNARKRPAKTTASVSPSTSGRAWPVASPSSRMASRRARAPSVPPGSMPASARRVATSPGPRTTTPAADARPAQVRCHQARQRPPAGEVGPHDRASGAGIGVADELAPAARLQECDHQRRTGVPAELELFAPCVRAEADPADRSARGRPHLAAQARFERARGRRRHEGRASAPCRPPRIERPHRE